MFLSTPRFKLCFSLLGALLNSVRRKIIIQADQASQKWWRVRNVSAFLHNFYHFSCLMEMAEKSQRMSAWVSFVEDWKEAQEERREKMSWKSMLSLLLIEVQLRKQIQKLCFMCGKWHSEAEKGCPEWKCTSLWSEDGKLKRKYSLGFFFLREVVFFKYALLDIMSRTNSSGFVPLTESACKGSGDVKLAS